MRRSIALLFFAVSVTVLTACSSVAGPNRGEDDEDSTEFCSVVGGTQTHCEDPR